MKTITILPLCLAVFFAGCRPQPQASEPVRETVSLDQYEALTNELARVVAQVNATSAQLVAVSNRLTGFIGFLQSYNPIGHDEFAQFTNTTANSYAAQEPTLMRITPDSAGYGYIHTSFGTFLASTRKVEPYMDGFKVTVTIGNLTSSDFVAAKLITYTLSEGVTNSDVGSHTNTFPTPLKSGWWTPISFVLAPASAADVRDTYIGLEVHSVSLLQPSDL